MSDIIDIQALITIVRKAGSLIMDHYNSDKIDYYSKLDSSPVSAADLESDALICNELSRLYPKIPIISEERENLPLTSNIFWLIDPLDGTKCFLNRNGEFTVNIALIIDRKPVIGVVYSPLSDQLYYVDQSKVAYKQSSNNLPVVIQARAVPSTGLTILVSSSPTKEDKLTQYLKDKKIDKIIPTSSSLKLCLISEGNADLYPRFGMTMEWDIAAGHAILNAAGGSIKTLDKNELSYGHSELEYYNPEFIAMGKN
jgi:3'(2'), 5'-bisphosphate nucleotidase